MDFRFEVEFICPDCGGQTLETFDQSDTNQFHEIYCYE